MRDAAEAYVVTLESRKAAVTGGSAEPAQTPPWAVEMLCRLEAIETAGKQHTTDRREAMSRIDRRVELLAETLRLLAKALGVKLPQAPEPMLNPEAKLKPVFKELSEKRQEQLIALGSMTSMRTREDSND